MMLGLLKSMRMISGPFLVIKACRASVILCNSCTVFEQPCVMFLHVVNWSLTWKCFQIVSSSKNSLEVWKIITPFYKNSLAEVSQLLTLCFHFSDRKKRFRTGNRCERLQTLLFIVYAFEFDLYVQMRQKNVELLRNGVKLAVANVKWVSVIAVHLTLVVLIIDEFFHRK